jgi:hypothetical protein
MLVLGAALLAVLAAGSPAAADGAACGPSCPERIHAPAPRIVIEQSKPEVVFKQAPCSTVAAPCNPQPTCAAPKRCGLFHRHCCPAPVQSYTVQTVQPAPVMAAPVTYQAVQPAPVVAVQPAPIVAAPVTVQAVQPAPVVAAPVQQVVAAPMAVQLVPATVTAPCGPQRFTQDADLDAAADLLRRARAILASQPSAITDGDAAAELRAIRTRLDKMEKLLGLHDDWIQQKRAAEK